MPRFLITQLERHAYHIDAMTLEDAQEIAAEQDPGHNEVVYHEARVLEIEEAEAGGSWTPPTSSAAAPPSPQAPPKAPAGGLTQ